MKQRGRPKLKELPTRRFILEAATLLFREDGFKRISIERICQRAGISKMSFYRSQASPTAFIHGRRIRLIIKEPPFHTYGDGKKHSRL